jgi:TRAP-type C4-dicarboxylate transport system permease small subunit
MGKVLQHLIAVMNRVSTMMGYLSGGAFLLLSCYTGWEAIGRKYGLPYSGFSDEISSYVLAIAGCWGMGYALKEGSHVRIEVITSLMPRKLQGFLSLLALFMLIAFGAFLAYFMAGLALESYGIGARGISSLRAPLAIPQFLTAFGLAIFSLHGLILFFCHVLGVDVPGKTVSSESEI